MIYDVVIIGSGPAGYTAAIYCARAMLQPLMVTGEMVGGQLMKTTDVENFPGYSEGVTGPQMMEDLHKQAEHFGTTFKTTDVKSVDAGESTFRVRLVNNEEIEARSVIVATGANSLWLNAEGETPLQCNGISTCATCDGAFFKDEEIVVVGGGDSAMEEAVFLTRYASKVTIIHRRHQFRASKIMLDRARNTDKIAWKCGFAVTKWLAENGALRGAVLEDCDTHAREEIPCTGAFIAIGHKPNTSFIADTVRLDEDGYIVHEEHTMTSVPGIFACGDACASSTRYRQAITAAGEGCKAAMDCEKWLESSQ